jgi:hypothetical protein
MKKLGSPVNPVRLASGPTLETKLKCPTKGSKEARHETRGEVNA